MPGGTEPPHRVNLLHVVPTYLPATRYGGPIYSVHALCAALAKRGHATQVYTTNVDGPDVSDVPLGVPAGMDGVDITYFPTGIGRRLYRSPGMGAALCQNVASFDILHLHSVFLWPTAAAAAAARRAGVPYVISPRGMLVSDLISRKSRHLKTAWINLVEHRNIANAAAVHVTSQIEAEELCKLGLASNRIVVIPNGMDVPPVVPGAGQHSRDHDPNRPLVLSLGRISWKKGLDRLIRAMTLVPGAHLAIAGNDEEHYQPRLEALAREAGVAGRTHFVGALHGHAKWDQIASADVFALASYSENFGNAVLEAMAMGVPVIVTPQVGLASTVAETGSGLVVEGDPQQFGAAIARLLADPGQRRAMGEAGRRAVAERFSWAAIAQSMETLYGEIATRTPLGV